VNTKVDLAAHGASYTIEVDRSTHIGKLIAEGHPYERPLLEHIYRQGFSGVAVDVGANIGNHSLWFAAVCGLPVVAFEPVTHKELRRNVEGYDVSVQPVALGAKPGRARHVGDWRLKPGGDLPVVTLDSFGLMGVAFIKIDVEGMEPDVLAGTSDLLSREHPVIYAETWGDDATARVRKVLAPHGYRRTKRIPTATIVEEWRA
jgi:FkbM family methyltransferase